MAFWGIQNGKTHPFFTISPRTFVQIFIDKRPFTYVLVFENTKKILGYSGKQQFLMIIFHKFQHFRKFRIRDSSLIAMFNLHRLLKTNWFYL